MNNGKRSLSVGILIDERPLSRFQIRVFALCGLIMLLDGFDALCMRFLAPAIVDDLGIPLRTFGPVFAASLIGLMVAGMADSHLRHGNQQTCCQKHRLFDIWFPNDLECGG